MRTGIAIVLLVSILSGLCWATTTPKQARSKIKDLNQSIHTIKHKINETQQHKQKLQTKLQKLDQQIGHITKKLHQTRQQLHQTRKELEQTRKQRHNQQTQLRQQKQQLSQIIQATYQMGQQPYIKLVLNQQQPDTFNRYLHYARALTQHQLNLFNKIQNTLNQLQQTKQQLANKQQKLKQLKQHQHQRQQHLQKSKHKRQQVIHHLDQALQHSHQRLKAVKENKAQLQKILHKASQQNHYNVKGKHFYQAKGHLAWPIESRNITQTYGEPKLNGRFRSSGIKINAEGGQPIHAIFHGQVVFAHWLRGYGLMAVIQHGPHYMTLYAHAQSLYIQKGDKVDPGDIIATVGQSGGLEQSALYFEIRHNGHAINPMSWLKTS